MRGPVSDTAETVAPSGARATKSIPYRKIVLFGAFVPLAVVVAAPLMFHADAPPVAANILKCYDSSGNHVPCATEARASPSPPTGRTTAAQQPASWIATARYQQVSWATTGVDQPASWASAAVDQPATGAPAAPRSSTPLKRQAYASCRRHLLPCFFSTLRRGLHLAAAAGAQARSARERQGG